MSYQEKLIKPFTSKISLCHTSHSFYGQLQHFGFAFTHFLAPRLRALEIEEGYYYCLKYAVSVSMQRHIALAYPNNEADLNVFGSFVDTGT